MFKGHPKGLYALALANTGERFGYYTMLAIFVLFLQAKFGYNEAQAGHIYGLFLGCVYFMPLIGGMLADRFGYGKMVKSGIVVMFLGYLLLAVPMATTTAKVTMFSALALIAIGTGLFKGNLQVMVGNLYDEAKYSAFRDNGFSLFYMAINIGSMFAPMTCSSARQASAMCRRFLRWLISIWMERFLPMPCLPLRLWQYSRAAMSTTCLALPTAISMPCQAPIITVSEWLAFH